MLESKITIELKLALSKKLDCPPYIYYYTNRHILDEGESYKVYKSDSYRYNIICKDLTYKFRIRASLLKKKGVVITILTPYSYSLANHYKNK